VIFDTPYASLILQYQIEFLLRTMYPSKSSSVSRVLVLGLTVQQDEQFLTVLGTANTDDNNPVKPNGNYTYQLLQQSVAPHFVFMGFA
jgi:hypothetical protein